jgi:hypothetical protein
VPDDQAQIRDLLAAMAAGYRAKDKTGGRWRLTHMHASVPFNMDQTFKAAVDLQP